MCSQREMKRAGREAANKWLAKAQANAVVQLGTARFEYGHTLNSLRDITGIPSSSDRDYSWGFFKQVKSRVFSYVGKGLGSYRSHIQTPAKSDKLNHQVHDIVGAEQY